MSKLTEQITLHLTKDTLDELSVESEKREGGIGAVETRTARQLVEERLEQIERKNITMMEFTDINIGTIEGVLLCRAIGSLMSCPDHSTKTPDEMVKFLEDMSSVN